MDLLGLFGLFLLLFTGGAAQTAPSAPPAPPRRNPQLPPARPSRGTPALPPAPAPWPQVLPGGLPPFPGPQWEYDEPPPLAVQQRAGQLVDSLWKQGSGAFKIEQTDARWIAYRAELVRSGNKGVVAYRLKQTATLPPSSKPPARPPKIVPSSTSKPPPPAWNVTVMPAQVVPEVVPTSALALPTLQYGAGLKPQKPNNDVKLLQQKLGIAADGQFGKDTRAAVQNYQRAHGLDADGIVGKKTWASLFGV